MAQPRPLSYTTLNPYIKFPPDFYGDVVAERTFKACSDAKIQSPKVLGNLCNESDPQNLEHLTNVPPSYASLKRLGKLPKMQKLRRIANKDIQKIAQNVADGKYDCKVTFCKGNNDSGRLYFYIYFDEEDNKKLAKPKEKDVKYDFRVTVVLNEVHDTFHPSSHEIVIGCDPPYMMNGSLSSEQKTDIYYRLLHHMFRTHGMDIYNMGLDHFFIKNLFQTIGMHWTTKRDGQLAEDAYFTGVDILARLDQYWDTIKYLLHALGESYETFEQSKKAGDIYSATMNFYNRSFTITDATTFNYNAGLAYRNCNEFALAESSFILAIYYTFKPVQPIPMLNDVLKSMYMMYQMMDVKKTTGFQPIHPIVGALTTVAGLNNNNHMGRPQEAIHRHMAESNFQMILKPCYRNKSAAYNRIKALATVPTINAFREQLYDSCDQNTVFAFRMERNPEYTNEPGSSVAARAMRDQLRPNTGYDKSFGENRATPYCCEVCKLMEEFNTGGKLSQCPCKNVYYCSKLCQKAHWRFHKQFCKAEVNKKNKPKKKDTKEDEEEDAREKLSNVSISATTSTSCHKCGSSKIPEGRDTLFKCPCSLGIYYCSKDCQRNDWIEHKVAHKKATS